MLNPLGPVNELISRLIKLVDAVGLRTPANRQMVRLEIIIGVLMIAAIALQFGKVFLMTIVYAVFFGSKYPTGEDRHTLVFMYVMSASFGGVFVREMLEWAVGSVSGKPPRKRI